MIGILIFQTKTIVADNFLISASNDKYRIRVNFNSTDFLHPYVKNLFHELNGQKLTTWDQDNDQWSR